MTLESNSQITDALITNANAIVNSRNERRRAEQRQRRAQRAEREQNRAAATEFLDQDTREFRTKAGLTDTERELQLGSQVSVDIDDEAWAFGEDPSYMGGDRRGQDDEQSYTREEKIKNSVLGDDFLTENEKFRELEGTNIVVGGKKPQVAKVGNATPAMRDALVDLRRAKETYGYDAFGAEGEAMAGLETSLSEQAEPAERRKRERRVAADAVSEDRRIREGNLTDDEIATEYKKRISTIEENRSGITSRPRFEAAAQRNQSGDIELANEYLSEMLARRADAQSAGPIRRAMAVQARAEAEAEGFRNQGAGLSRQLAEEDIGRIEEIRSLGGATPFASHDAVGNFQVVRAVNPGAFSDAIPLYDKDGNIREYYGSEDGAMVQLGEVNIDSSDQALNAPKPTPGQEFVSRNLPAYGRPGATTFGYPQVGINDELALLGDRVRGLSGYGLEGMGDPRSIEDFEKVMSGIVGRAGQRGDAFFTRDPETGKQVVVPNPGVDDVLAKLGYSPNDKERLANALYQGQAARVVDVNTDDKRAFYGRYDSPRASSEVDINFDSAELRPDGGLQLQKLGNEKVGRGKNAKSAKAGLRAISEQSVLDSLGADASTQVQERVRRPDGSYEIRPVVGRGGKPKMVQLPEAARAIAGAADARNDAQMPLIAQLANEDSERARFVKGDDRNLTESQLVAKYGGNRGQQAAEVLRRAKEDEQLRAQASSADDAVARKFRQREASIRAKSGLPVPENLTAVQPTQQAAVPASISLDPGVGTGNQTSPGSDAGVGRIVPGLEYESGIGGGGGKPPAPVAASPAPSEGGGRPLTPELRQELFNLPSRDVSTPDGPDQGFAKERRRREAERRLTNRRGKRIAQGTGISLGALAAGLGIAGVTRGEEEQQPQEGLY